MNLLDRIAVNVHPDPKLPLGSYRGVTFEGKGLMTNTPFRVAYQEAERFIELLSQRARGAQLLRSVFLQRICSSFMSGLMTV